MKVCMCDVCLKRDRLYRKSAHKWSWRNGPKIDVCDEHDNDLRMRNNWSGIQINAWIERGFPAEQVTAPKITYTFIPIPAPTAEELAKKELA